MGTGEAGETDTISLTVSMEKLLVRSLAQRIEEYWPGWEGRGWASRWQMSSVQGLWVQSRPSSHEGYMRLSWVHCTQAIGAVTRFCTIFHCSSSFLPAYWPACLPTCLPGFPADRESVVPLPLHPPGQGLPGVPRDAVSGGAAGRARL